MTTPFLAGSYLTIEEYRAAPTALQTNNLVPGAGQATQDAELAGIIGRASRMIDSWARQPLWATAGTQSEQVRVVNGDAILHARQDRVKAITAFSYGPSWASMTALANPACFIEENRVLVGLTGGGATWSGALNLVSPTARGKVFAAWSYVAGWVTTVLVAPATTGQSTITVDNPAGIVVGASGLSILNLRLAAGAVQNTYQVLAVAGPVVTLTQPLEEDWPAGAGVSEVPDDVKEAAVLVVSHYIKMRKGAGLVMEKVPKPSATTKDELGSEMGQAKQIAERYLRKSP